MLALVGIPLGIATRKGGRSRRVRQRDLPGLLLLLPVVRLADRPGEAADAAGAGGALAAERGVLRRRPDFSDPHGAAGRPRFASAICAARLADFFKALKERGDGQRTGRDCGWRLPLLPQIVDTYILSSFLSYLVLMLASFVSLTQVYNFFELIGDMLRNNISLWHDVHLPVLPDARS